MDPTTLNTIVGIIGAIVGIIGIVIGLIGLKSVSTAIKIKNSIKANTVQQAQVIKNGLDDYAVIRLSRDTTKEELERLIEDIHPVVWEELDDVVDKKIQKTNKDVSQLQERIDKMPTIHISEEEPTDSKEGDIWLKPV